MAEDFYPFVDNGPSPDGTDDATQISPQGASQGSVSPTHQPVASHLGGPDLPMPPTPARIAVYDDMLMPPRVVMVEPSDVRSYLAEITKTVYDLAFQHCSEWSFQVIRELVENLIHASFMEPTISILDGGKTIIFCDHGPGIPNKQAALKPSFSSATAQMKRYIRGVGSGLPIVEEWLRMHHGNLTIEDNLGQGTSVTVSLLQKDEPSQTRNTENGNVTVVDRPPTMGYPGAWANPFGSYFATQQGYFSPYGAAQGSFAPGTPMFGYMQGNPMQDGTVQAGMASNPFTTGNQPQAQSGYYQGGYPQQSGGYQAPQGYQPGYPGSYPPACQSGYQYPPQGAQPGQVMQGIQQGYPPSYRQVAYPGQNPTYGPQEQAYQTMGYRPGHTAQGGVRAGRTDPYGSPVRADYPSYNQPDTRNDRQGWEQQLPFRNEYGQDSRGQTTAPINGRNEAQQTGTTYRTGSHSDPYADKTRIPEYFPDNPYRDSRTAAVAGLTANAAAPNDGTATGHSTEQHAAESSVQTPQAQGAAGTDQKGSTASRVATSTTTLESGINAHVPLTRDQRDIILLFAVNEKIGPKELNEQLGIPSASGSRKLKEIKEAGYIGKKGQKYILTGEGQRMLAYLKTNEG